MSEVRGEVKESAWEDVETLLVDNWTWELSWSCTTGLSSLTPACNCDLSPVSRIRMVSLVHESNSLQEKIILKLPAKPASLKVFTWNFVLCHSSHTGSCWWRRVLKRGAWWSSASIITVITNLAFTCVDLLVFSERWWVRVALVTTSDSAVVGFVCGMNMHVLLTITGVSKPSVTSLNLTLKWFLT